MRVVVTLMTCEISSIRKWRHKVYWITSPKWKDIWWRVLKQESFDILKWWKVNSTKFLILFCISQDELAISITTVASDSIFSKGGRVMVNTYRSSILYEFNIFIMHFQRLILGWCLSLWMIDIALGWSLWMIEMMVLTFVVLMLIFLLFMIIMLDEWCHLCWLIIMDDIMLLIVGHLNSWTFVECWYGDQMVFLITKYLYFVYFLILGNMLCIMANFAIYILIILNLNMKGKQSGHQIQYDHSLLWL